MLLDLLLGERESHVMHVGCYRTGYIVGTMDWNREGHHLTVLKSCTGHPTCMHWMFMLKSWAAAAP